MKNLIYHMKVEHSTWILFFEKENVQHKVSSEIGSYILISHVRSGTNLEGHSFLNDIRNCLRSPYKWLDVSRFSCSGIPLQDLLRKSPFKQL